jgi:hypothetical protein
VTGGHRKGGRCPLGVDKKPGLSMGGGGFSYCGHLSATERLGLETNIHEINFLTPIKISTHKIKIFYLSLTRPKFDFSPNPCYNIEVRRKQTLHSFKY